MNTETQSNITKTLVIPIYKNSENITSLLNALETLASKHRPNFEVVFVIDGSPDDSEAKLTAVLPQLSYPVQIISLSRNFGSFEAVRAGMRNAKGKFIAVMAADLQEPPELIHDFFDILEKDAADVVFGQRIGREDALIKKFFANIYWTFYKKVICPDIPKGGVDIFACNKQVSHAILAIEERNSSLVSQLFWVGFRRSYIPYKRRKREHGKSAWSFKKRMHYMLDSIFSFSDLPITSILSIGVFSFVFSFIALMTTIFGKLFGLIQVPGYTTITLLVLFFGSLMLTTQGIIGTYLWRTFENTKKRPLAIIKSIQSNEDANTE